MKLKESISVLIKKTYLQAITNLSENYTGSSLTDIFITVDKESGEIVFYDDEENRVADVVIFNWINKVDELSDEYVSSALKTITQELNDENAFDTLDIYKPFSVNYADDNMVIIDELLTISDDSLVLLDNDLIEKFDREFDEFLEKLLKE